MVVDDDELAHWAIRVLLADRPWHRCVLGARTRHDALALARRHEPEVAVVGLVVAGEPWPEICTALRRACPQTRVLVMAEAESISSAAAHAAGACGVVSAHWRASEIARAIWMVGSGMAAFPTEHKEADHVSR